MSPMHHSHPMSLLVSPVTPIYRWVLCTTAIWCHWWVSPMTTIFSKSLMPVSYTLALMLLWCPFFYDCYVHQSSVISDVHVMPIYLRVLCSSIICCHWFPCDANLSKSVMPINPLLSLRSTEDKVHVMPIYLRVACPSIKYCHWCICDAHSSKSAMPIVTDSLALSDVHNLSDIIIMLCTDRWLGTWHGTLQSHKPCLGSIECLDD